jgi:hypothetical protein
MESLATPNYHFQASGARKMATFEIPTVTTERLRLRAFRSSDLDVCVPKTLSALTS